MARLTPPLKGLEIWACEWEDAHWNSGEMDKDDIVHRPVLYVSVGILLKDDETGMTIATDVAEAGSFRGFNFVPAKMITKKWKVGAITPKVGRKKKAKGEEAADHVVAVGPDGILRLEGIPSTSKTVVQLGSSGVVG